MGNTDVVHISTASPTARRPVKFTPDQRKAIQHDGGHLQLIACAGSGKTEVVARHVVQLLRRKGTKPENIVAFTFTDKAAAELKERIMTRCREEIGNVVGMAEMYVGTIHGFCLHVLQNEAPEYLKFTVLNEVQQALLVERNSRESGLTTTHDLKAKPLRRYLDTEIYLTALTILREGNYDEKALKKKSPSLLAGVESYEELLRRKSLLDYTAIMVEAAAVLGQDPDVGRRLLGRVKHVIVDEYQDVNPVQEEVVRLFSKAGATVCVVGDDGQTLYRWRGSAIEKILTFEKRYKGVTQVFLQENFRSSPGIVETARDFIAKNTKRRKKAMVATPAQKYDPGDIVALAFDSPKEEAEHIVRTIRSLVGVAFDDRGRRRGLTYSDFAVLLRSVRKNAEPVIEALKAAGIKYVVGGLDGLFKAPEAVAARALFQFVGGDEEVKEADVLEAWRAADLGIPPRTLKAAVADAARVRREIAAGKEKRFSVYNIQRQFRDFLAAVSLREETVPNGRGEVVFYNLGRFSQLISDFESIHYKSDPQRKYQTFAEFLKYRGAHSYPEGGDDREIGTPDAVQVMTVHQAKGMEWPAVFVPALIKNRFPAKKMGGRSVWHVLPDGVVADEEGYRGGLEDERRLFYVAMTRAQKFLHLTWAPVPTGNNLYEKPSEFWTDVLASKFVRRMAPSYAGRPKAKAAAREDRLRITLSFSDIKYFFECPYQFNLRLLYGFNPPIDEALGYGKSLHDVLAEVHMRAIDGKRTTDRDVPDLIERHLHVPYAYADLEKRLRESARKIARDYLADNAADLENLEFAEKTIEVDLGDGVTVVGRIDLVRRKDTGETTIVDLKTNDRTQPEQVTEAQLNTYALGYRDLTGRDADFVEVYKLEERKGERRSVDNDLVDHVKAEVKRAADHIRRADYPARAGRKVCGGCDFVPLCSAGTAATG